MYTIARPLPGDVLHLWREIATQSEAMVDPPAALSELVSLWGTSWCIFTGCVAEKVGAWFILTDPTYYGEKWNSAGLTVVVLPEYRGKHALALLDLFFTHCKAWGFTRLWTNCRTPQARKLARLCHFTRHSQEGDYVVYELLVQEYKACPRTRKK